MHLKKSETKQKLNKFSFEAIGTQWHIEYSGADVTTGIEQLVLDRIELFDKVYSRFRSDSIITRMSKSAGEYELPEDSVKLLDFYDHLYRVTSGDVTPLIGDTLADAGYDATYSLRSKHKTPALAPEEVYERKQNVITMKRPAIIDVGAVGKGYLIDIVHVLLKDHGVTSVIINAGGDIAVSVEKNVPVQIALEQPKNTSQAIGIATFHQGSLCGSSIYLRKWGSRHHIINPRTAESPMHIQAVWVYAKNTALADGLSTALFFTPAEKLKQHFDFEYAIMNADGSLVYSQDFPASFFD